jgi:restriction system protein
VLAYWYNLNGYDFEREVAIVFTSLGFNAKITPKSNDGGVDIILKMGNKTTYVQCKAFKSNVGVAVVRELYGVMQSDNIKSGIVVTLNGFSQGAIDFAEGKNIELITAKDLISMIK